MFLNNWRRTFDYFVCKLMNLWLVLLA